MSSFYQLRESGYRFGIGRFLQFVQDLFLDEGFRLFQAGEQIQLLDGPFVVDPIAVEQLGNEPEFVAQGYRLSQIRPCLA